ncbi:MAG: hypothetical protein LH606_11515 [Cytophagaceae bacterium]|nr:hypothetical protein [Cytophagaceae bacterium]
MARISENVYFKPSPTTLPRVDSLLKHFGKTRNNSVFVRARFTFRITGRTVPIRCQQRQDTISEGDVLLVEVLP